MLSVKSQHNTTVTTTLCICIFPQNHTGFIDIKMKCDSYERMTMLSTDIPFCSQEFYVF